MHDMPHSAAAREKMSAARRARRGYTLSAETKAAISASNTGKVRARTHHKVCVCGTAFVSASPAAVFHSVKCKRASYGHGLVHAPEFAGFPRACAICTSVHELVGDHDHKTGAPRGVLCRKCNLAIGNMLDNPALLRAAADYLEERT